MHHSVHLVGSVPLSSSDAVFRAVGHELGALVARIPDGETGARANWLAWQVPVLAINPCLEPIDPGTWSPDGSGHLPPPLVRLRPGADPRALVFSELGYARAALDSYTVFASLRAAAVLPAATRFQVSLPTPAAPILLLVNENDRPAVLPAYQARLLAELDHILTTVPHHDLAIQWDVAIEIAMLEGALAPAPPDATPTVAAATVAESLAYLAHAIPADVELGFHFCYGDSGHRHFIQPRDTRTVVDLVNRLTAGIHRRINWIHLPVPADRTDDDYFQPLSTLDSRHLDSVYLGLLHARDGLTGALHRISSARRFLPAFGIATECGFGRRDPHSIGALLALHRTVAHHR